MWLDVLNQMKKESGKTTEQISVESGVPRGTLNKLFAGQTKDPGYRTLVAVVHCLGHTVDDLEQQKKSPPADLPADEDKVMEIARQLQQLVIDWGWTTDGVPLSPDQANMLKAIALMADAGRRKGAQD